MQWLIIAKAKGRDGFLPGPSIDMLGKMGYLNCYS